MQTFLPDSDLTNVSKILDKKRLFKQVVEARQILATLGIPVFKDNGVQYKPSHVNHPCVKMWKGYENLLIEYHNVLLEECIHRNINTAMQPLTIQGDIKIPYWFNKELIDSHKSNLLRKDPVFYGKYNWNVSSTLPYYWPTKV